MKKKDRDFIIKFTLASSATLIVAGCTTGCVYGPPPAYDRYEPVGVPIEGDQPISRESKNSHDS